MVTTMDERADKLRQAREKLALDKATQQRHEDQMQRSDSLQKILFDGFKGIIGAVEDGNDKAAIITLIVQTLDKLDKQTGDNKTDLEVMKTGLKTLEKQIADVPTGSLKQLPKFLERPDKITIQNFGDIENYFQELKEAIEAKELVVPAPKVVVKPTDVKVPAPQVHVDAPDLSGVASSINTMSELLKKLKLGNVTGDGAMEVYHTNTFINEKYDEYRIAYDDFDEGSDQIESISYYLAGKMVAKVSFKYDRRGNVTGVKRSK